MIGKGDGGVAVRPATRAFTASEYQRMAEVGILGEDDPFELIEGEIVRMSPVGTRHSACVDRLNRLLVRAAGERAIVRIQGDDQLVARSRPQPDVALLKPHPDFYAGRHPGPEDILLLIEVADSAPVYDREVKLPLYVRAGLAEIWLVDLIAHEIEVHRAGAATRLRRDDSVDVPGLPGVTLRCDQILP